MKAYHPLYYNKFRCIADKCKHSCCVGWDIRIDNETFRKYEKLPDPETITKHIDDGEIVLKSDGRCPFLDERGLCFVISHFGEAYTSEICRRHPRFCHRVGDRVEFGIGASCEEAARIILLSDDYADFGIAEQDIEPAEETDFDSISHREKIYAILSDKNKSYAEKRSKIIELYNLPDIVENSQVWSGVLTELEYLDGKHRGSFTVGEKIQNSDCSVYCERFLAYLIFRHLSPAENLFNLRARLGFCLLLADCLENFLAKTEPEFEEIKEYCRAISEEIEYSEDNTASLIFEWECELT